MSRFVAEIPEELFDSEVPSNRYEDDLPFDRDYSDRGDRYGSSYGGSTYGSISSYGGSAYSGSAYAGSKAQDNGRTARPRLKAVYKKPSTDDAKKPYIAKAGGKGLSSLSKGMPSAPSAPDYGPGDRVRHTKYGEGTVKAVEAGPRDYKVTVQFDEYGQKIMYAAFAKLVRC
jgi:DNA helicase-2/ATP-dependent DNA helicase PcrA